MLFELECFSVYPYRIKTRYLPMYYYRTSYRLNIMNYNHWLYRLKHIVLSKKVNKMKNYHEQYYD